MFPLTMTSGVPFCPQVPPHTMPLPHQNVRPPERNMPQFILLFGSKFAVFPSTVNKLLAFISEDSLGCQRDTIRSHLRRRFCARRSSLIMSLLRYDFADAGYTSTGPYGALSLWVCLFLACPMSALSACVPSWLQQHGNN